MDLDGIDDALGLSNDKSQTLGAYIYQPPKHGKLAGERPSKRRKVSSITASDEKLDRKCFVPLLNGEENAESVQLRYDSYQQLWPKQEHKIQAILEDVDAGVLTDVSSFVRNTSPQTCDGCIPTALVTVGSNVSSLGRLLSRLNDQLLSTGEGSVVVLESGDAPNLKTTLKNIIRTTVTNTDGNDGYQRFLTDRAGPRLLGYDLDLLHDYVQRKGTKKLVLALRDSEAFDPGLLTDLLSLFKSWLDRIPFTVLLGISTSIELFEGRLPRSCVALLQGKHFEVQEAGNCVDRIYESLQTDPDTQLWLGRNVTNTLFENTSDYFQSPEAFSRMFKYAYMSHFFANPLAVLLANPNSAILTQNKLCEAIRNLPSFRMFCEDLVEEGSTKQVRDMLENDKYLLQETPKYLDASQERMRKFFQAVRIIHTFLQHIQSGKKTSIPDLSVRALSGELSESTIVEEMFATAKTLDSDKLDDILNHLRAIAISSEVGVIQEDLGKLLETCSNSGPLRSGYNINSTVTKTTVVQQRIRLSKGKVDLSEQDAEYTNIVDRLVALLQVHLTEALIDPHDLFLHEVFLFDLRNPLKETFAPRPRFAIERALATPFDYLLSSSDVAMTKVSAKQPATAILYQLYLDSGALVNVHDLWQAFYGIFETEEAGGCDDRIVMSLFYSALAELKAFGVIKNSRKKTDHLAKSAWMGL
ncbi:Origin recognition complex subunit 3 [Penicillium paradoxum]|uniref:Origin recognition complex subunit 3 n=1 Tax=Penicillium paradoxum TaxID=176176 RepID=UPI002549BCD3|nr:Origin recognition complex subunit 3 [Penicillium paradoxum]KAJ5782221.1 Origin recognition complex subunit 3 [Penicillium paradoxum]